MSAAIKLLFKQPETTLSAELMRLSSQINNHILVTVESENPPC
jgi:sensor histidine kinase YesM